MKSDISKKLNMFTIGAILIDVLFIALSVFLIVNPELSVNVAGVLIGIVLIISGLAKIIHFLLNSSRAFLYTSNLLFGILSVLVGALITFNPFSLANMISICVGIWLLIASVYKLGITFQFKRNSEQTWFFNFVISILTIFIAILLLVNPFASSIILSIYAGIMIFVYAAMDIVEKLLYRKRFKEIEKILFK